MSAAATLRIALVGPTHPYKGGVAAHTTSLAHELADAGHDVTLVSWAHLYPSRLYPGEQAQPGGRPDVEPYPRTERSLSWARPDTLVRAGRSLRQVDLVIVVHVIPPVVPLHLLLLGALGRGPRTVVVAHNVLPHEPHPGERGLMRRLLTRVDAALVHSREQAGLARELGARHVVVADLPPHLPGGPRRPHVAPAPGQTEVRLLALGLVRGYKGLDVLLEAMRAVPGVRLTIAGEMWGEAGERLRALAADPELADRVEIRGGYVPADEIADLMARHDVFTLTYRSATASQNVLLAHAHGLPVLASAVGTFGEQVEDGVDGLLVPPGDVAALTAALRRLTEPGALAGLRGGVTPPDLHGPWARYVGTLEALTSAVPADPFGSASSSPARAADTTAAGPTDAPAAAPTSGRLRAAVGRARGALQDRSSARGDRRSLSRRDFDASVRPTDVLATDEQADAAREQARALGLPRPGDPLAAWAALGALEALLAVRDDGRREAAVLDASGGASPFARWAEVVGFTVETTAGGEGGAGALGDPEAGSLDVITRLHPFDVASAEVEDVLAEAGWALRPGGLLCLTLPVGGAGLEGVATAADLRGVVARAEEVGLSLVGDLDGELTARLRRAARVSTEPDAAHALVRLTLRRR